MTDYTLKVRYGDNCYTHTLAAMNMEQADRGFQQWLYGHRHLTKDCCDSWLVAKTEFLCNS